MIDYYSELHLDRALGLSEINKELSRLESTWKRREITNPEKATKILATIIDAREVFKTDVTRREYDLALAKSKQSTSDIDPKEYNRRTMKKWWETAKSYFIGGQYDLAKAAITKTLSYSNEKDDDDLLFALASDIYRANGDNRLALDYINKAIIISPETPYYYISRGHVYFALEMDDQGWNSSNDDKYFQMQIQSFLTSVRMAEKKGDKAVQAKGLGFLAHTYYQHNFQEQAEQFALQAKNLGGDPNGNADEVLNAIENVRKEEEERRKAEKAAEATRRARAEREERERIANQKKREEIEQANRERGERIENWKRGVKMLNALAHVLFVVCAVGIILTCVTFDMSEIDTDILTIISFGTIAFLNIASSMYRNEYPDDVFFQGGTFGGITFSVIAGLVVSFYIATVKYTQMGFNWESASQTWEIFGGLIASILSITIFCRILGKIVWKSFNPQNAN